jgi:hypothetical protein
MAMLSTEDIAIKLLCEEKKKRKNQSYLHGLGGALAENLIVLQQQQQQQSKNTPYEKRKKKKKKKKRTEFACQGRTTHVKDTTKKKSILLLTLPYLPVGSTSTYPGSGNKDDPSPLMCSCRAPIIPYATRRTPAQH